MLIRLVEQMNDRPVLCVLAASALGLGLDALVDWPWMQLLMPACLFMMLFPAMMQLKLDALRRIRSRPWPFLAACASNALLAPLLVWTWAALIGPHVSTPVITGLVIFGLIPCGSMTPAFTAMARGNVTMTTAVMGVCMLGSVLWVPLWAGLILGGHVGSPLILLRQMLLVILLPLLLAQGFKVLLKRMGERRAAPLKRAVALMPGVGLFLIGVVMFFRNGHLVLTHPAILLHVGLPAMGHLLLLLGVALVVVRCMRLAPAERTSYLFVASTRNIAASLALAAAAFGDETALVVVVTGPFIQMPYVITLLNVLKLPRFLPPPPGPPEADSPDKA